MYVVLFNFAKDFDVSHHLLLDKLKSLGICSPLIDNRLDSGFSYWSCYEGFSFGYSVSSTGERVRSADLFVNHLPTY